MTINFEEDSDDDFTILPTVCQGPQAAEKQDSSVYKLDG